MIAKAFYALRHDASLTPAQRGTLMLKLGELTDRITLLNEEIARLEAARASKSATRTAADAFFKR